MSFQNDLHSVPSNGNLRDFITINSNEYKCDSECLEDLIDVECDCHNRSQKKSHDDLAACGFECINRNLSIEW